MIATVHFTCKLIQNKRCMHLERSPGYCQWHIWKVFWLHYWLHGMLNYFITYWNFLLVTVEQHEFKRGYKLESFHHNLIPFKLEIALLSFRAKCSCLSLDPMRSRPLFTSTGLSSPQQCNSWQFPQPTLSHYRPTSQRRGARSADNVESTLADNEVRVRKSAGASAERRDVSLCPTPHKSSC